MGSILLIPKNTEELELIRNFAQQHGLQFLVISDTGPKPYPAEGQELPVAEEAAAMYQTAQKNNKEDMEKVIVDITNDNDLQYIEQVLSERGISFRKEYDIDFQNRQRARQMLAVASQSWPSYDISLEEISAMVKEARAERYARNQDKDNH